MIRIDCSMHSGELAAWQCDDCNKALCPQCAAPGHMGLIRCGSCDGFARVLKLPAEVLPFLQTAQPFLRRFKEMDGILSLLVLSIVMGALSLGWVIGQFVGFVILTVYYLLLVRVSSEGEDALPDLSFDRLGGWSTALIRLLAAAAFLWGPFFFLLGLQDGLVDVVFMGKLEPLWSPIMTPLTVVFLFLLPATVILSATVESLLPLINPMNVFRLIRLLGSDYVKAALVWIGLVVIDRLWMILADGLSDASPVPLIVPILALPIGLLPALLSGFLLGRVVFQHGETLGLLRWEDLAREQVPGAQPLGERPRFRKTNQDEPLIEIELSEENGDVNPTPKAPEEEAVALSAEGDVSIALSGSEEDEMVGAGPEVDPVDQGQAFELDFTSGSSIEDALEAGADATAIARYAELQQSMPGGVRLPAATDAALARAFERSGDCRSAALAWQRIAELDLQGSEAAEAIYELARLLSGPLERPSAAEKLCRRVTREFPDSPYAARSGEILDSLWPESPESPESP